MSELACPECGFVAKAPKGLGAHRRRAHGVAGASKNAAYMREYQKRRKENGGAPLRSPKRKPARVHAPVRRPTIYRDGLLGRAEREALRKRLLWTVNAFAVEIKRYPKHVLAALREIVSSGFVPDRTSASLDAEDCYGAPPEW